MVEGKGPCLPGGDFSDGDGTRPADRFKEMLRRGRGLMSEGQWSDAISKFAEAVKLARAEKKEDWEIQAYCLIADTLRKKGDEDKAEAYYQKAMNKAMSCENRLGHALTLRGLGNIHLSRGNLDAAEGFFKSYLEVAEKIGVQSMIGLGHIGLANIAVEREDLGTAIESYKKGIDILEGTEEHEELAVAYVHLGDAFRMAGDFGTALGYFEKAMAECSRYGNIHRWALAEVRAAECCTRLGFVIRAMDHLESSRGVLMRVDDKSGQGEVYRVSGVLMTSQGNWSAAEAHFEKSIALLEERDRPLDLAIALMEQGRMFLQRGRMEEAKKAMERARELAVRFNSERLKVAAERLLKEIK